MQGTVQAARVQTTRLVGVVKISLDNFMLTSATTARAFVALNSASYSLANLMQYKGLRIAVMYGYAALCLHRYRQALLRLIAVASLPSVHKVLCLFCVQAVPDSIPCWPIPYAIFGTDWCPGQETGILELSHCACTSLRRLLCNIAVWCSASHVDPLYQEKRHSRWKQCKFS